MCPNRPDLTNTSPTSAPTQSISLSSSSSVSATNAIASNPVAAAVTSNLAHSIDSAADHFSPSHHLQPFSVSLTSISSGTQPTPVTASSTATRIASSSQQVVVGQLDTSLTIKKEESQQSQPQQFMNETLVADSVAKNTIFGLEMPFDVISAGYAALVATGGIIGYVKAGSIPSLAAGLTFGSILGVGAYMTSVNPDNYYLTLATSTGLGGLMGYRFINSGKFMPAGLIALLSLGMIARIGVRALTASPAGHVKE